MKAQGISILELDEEVQEENKLEFVKNWKILIVDDDENVHQITELALEGFSFAGCGLQFFNAYSGEEAKQIISAHDDIALILLDVVMETDHAGLDVARYVRDEPRNAATRIILRTGQPGQAPERSVITTYDINDYKEKTELTAQKLFTLMYSGLRSYRDIKIIQANKKGLEDVIEASANIFWIQSISLLAHGVLEQLTSLLYSGRNSFFASGKDLGPTKGLAAQLGYSGDLEIIAGTADFQPFVELPARKALDREVADALKKALDRKEDVHVDNNYTCYFGSKTGVDKILFLENVKSISPMDRQLIEVFCKNVSIAFDNINLKQEIADTQKDIVCRLGEAVETRSSEGGNHVKRMAEYCGILAKFYGFRDEDVELIQLASPLHDVGKIAIPDFILNKPGKLDVKEWGVMKSHSPIGYEMLQSSNLRILRVASIIANEHHEHWNGEGYPRGIQGENIHIFGRIACVADAFDALGSRRSYKEAWSNEEILTYLRDQRGKQFDPRLVDILLDHVYFFLDVKSKYSDD